MTRDEIWLEAVTKSKTETMPEHYTGYEAGYFDAALSREAEIATLRDRVKELEGMVPKWVNQSVEGGCAEVAALGDAKWKIADGRFLGAQWWSLMVPPIPLPEGEG